MKVIYNYINGTLIPAISQKTLDVYNPAEGHVYAQCPDSNSDDFDELFRALYDRASEYLPGKEGTAAILINEHQYKANFRIDKEINTMSLIQNLISRILVSFS